MESGSVIAEPSSTPGLSPRPTAAAAHSSRQQGSSRASLPGAMDWWNNALQAAEKGLQRAKEMGKKGLVSPCWSAP